MITSQYIPTQLYVFNLKQYYLSNPLYKYISCLTISVYKLFYNLNVEQFSIFPNVSYNIIFMLTVLEDLLITAIPIIIFYTFTYIVYSLHKIYYIRLCKIIYISDIWYNNNTYLYSTLFTLCSNALLKNSYTFTKHT